jgi:hypothetical protein
MISAETARWEMKETSQIFNEDFYLPLYLPLWWGLMRMIIVSGSYQNYQDLSCEYFADGRCKGGGECVFGDSESVDL